MSEIVLKIDADTEQWPEAEDFLNDLLEKHACPVKLQMQIVVAIEEMFVNVAHYAYPDGNGWVEIHADISDTQAKITLVDGGIPYDPLGHPDPDVDAMAQESKIGGLGILMVKKLMDEMKYIYKDGQNCLTVIKAL